MQTGIVVAYERAIWDDDGSSLEREVRVVLGQPKKWKRHDTDIVSCNSDIVVHLMS